MADEIERKFLVAGMDWESDVIDSSEIQQGYLAVNEQCRDGQRAQRRKHDVGVEAQAAQEAVTHVRADAQREGQEHDSELFHRASLYEIESQ